MTVSGFLFDFGPGRRRKLYVSGDQDADGRWGDTFVLTVVLWP